MSDIEEAKAEAIKVLEDLRGAAYFGPGDLLSYEEESERSGVMKAIDVALAALGIKPAGNAGDGAPYDPKATPPGLTDEVVEAIKEAFLAGIDWWAETPVAPLAAQTAAANIYARNALEALASLLPVREGWRKPTEADQDASPFIGWNGHVRQWVRWMEGAWRSAETHESWPVSLIHDLPAAPHDGGKS